MSNFDDVALAVARIELDERVLDECVTEVAGAAGGAPDDSLASRAAVMSAMVTSQALRKLDPLVYVRRLDQFLESTGMLDDDDTVEVRRFKRAAFELSMASASDLGRCDPTVRRQISAVLDQAGYVTVGA